MDRMKFTPGPWKHDADDPNVNVFAVKAGDFHVAEVVGCIDDDAQDRANAALIATAPKLYEQLRWLTDEVMRRERELNISIANVAECNRALDEADGIQF